MFVTLNSPIFWYTPRPGETDEDTEKLVAQIVAFAHARPGAKEEFCNDRHESRHDRAAEADPREGRAHGARRDQPLDEEFLAEVGKDGDRWVYTKRQTEILEGLKAKARERGLWNFWLTGSKPATG